MGAVRNPNKPADEQNFQEMTAVLVSQARKESLNNSIHRYLKKTKNIL